MSGAATEGLPPEEGQPLGEPLEMSEDEIQRLVAQLGPVGNRFVIGGGRFLAVPESSHFVDLARAEAILPSVSGYTEIVLHSGASVEVPIDPAALIEAIVGTMSESGPSPEGAS